MANLLEDLKSAQQGSLICYGWPGGVGDATLIPINVETKNEFMKTIIDRRMYSLPQKAVRSLLNLKFTAFIAAVFAVFSASTENSNTVPPELFVVEGGTG